LKTDRDSSEKFVNHMEQLLGSQEAGQLMGVIGERSRTSIRYNSRLKPVEDLKGEVVPWCLPFGRFWNKDNPPSTTIEYATGHYYIQESSAMLAVSAASAVIDFSDKVVADLTAAPGGKATQVAELITEGYLVANEVKKHRVQALLWNVNRHRLTNVIITSTPTETLTRSLPGYFDVVMVDAPCSGEGLFQQKKQSMRKWSKKNVTLCARRQRLILNNALKLLSKGGFLVYSTCTFSKEENEDQVEYLLHQECLPVELPKDMPVSPALSLNEDVNKCSRRIFPHREGGAGAFVSVVQKASHAQNSYNGSYITAKEKEPSLKFNTIESLSVQNLDGFLFQRKGLVCYFASDSIPEVLWRNSRQIGAVVVDQLRGNKIMYGSIHMPASNKIITVELTQAQRYIKGENLFLNLTDGYYFLAYNDVILGPVLIASGITMNQFPQPLRSSQ
jgi:16S rRNA C967 or C1407 C5-methylase (RsmB/RsmF family)